MVKGWTETQMAELCARDIPNGACVNLGIGLPERVMAVSQPDKLIFYHTENGLVGMGPPPPPGEEDMDLTNAGKKPATAIPGAAYFHHADSFAMVRGGHIDYSILGAMQVSDQGDLANWLVDEPDAIPAVGGAMDLVAGVPNVFVMTRHVTREGQPKLVRECSYPLTGTRVVTRIYTDLAVLDVTDSGFSLLALAPGVDLETLRALTAGRIISG